MRKELNVLFPKQLLDLKQQKSLTLTPLVSFKELMDNVDKMEVVAMVMYHCKVVYTRMQHQNLK